MQTGLGKESGEGVFPLRGRLSLQLKVKKPSQGIRDFCFHHRRCVRGSTEGGDEACVRERALCALELDNPGLERRMGGERAEGGDSHPWLEGTGYGGVRYGAGGPRVQLRWAAWLTS